ncbi:DUF4124 domain-containing protein [Casimicrobium huifangae]|uniref:DUF4124 domain-containing protein n=1 Tax=Casimicrobium huifangae TaxID=2591109 RepID=UPI0012EC9685|nr:DUF4124 domain-containing protein [Casimicrobium huifangae]
MIRILPLLVVATAMFALTPATAQTAFRCDQNGQTVYSDKPCPAGAAGKAVTPTHDSAAQKSASQDANQQMRKDNTELNKRLSEREAREAKERADARKAAAKATPAKDAGGKAGKAAANAKGSKLKSAKGNGGTSGKRKSAGTAAAIKPAA